MVVVNIKPTIFQEVEELLPGRYESFDQFVEIALRNQTALERQEVGEVSLAVDQSRIADEPSQRDSLPRQKAVGPPKPDWRGLVRKVGADFELKTRPATSPVDDKSVLWGQVNRFFPTVAGLRVLVSLLHKQDAASLPIGEWYETAADVAVRWGRHLERLDQAAGRKRGDLWATGFPSEDRASIRRYVSQFLGTPTGTQGAAEQLRLVVFQEPDATEVTLTPAGVQLASLENPVFDTSSPRTTFSVFETRFFLDQMQRVLPAEYRLMRLVAELIENDADRSALNAELARRFPQWSSFVSTMRAGVIGRLHDLGLLTRIRKAQRVEYAITDLARDLGLLDGDTHT